MVHQWAADDADEVCCKVGSMVSKSQGWPQPALNRLINCCRVIQQEVSRERPCLTRLIIWRLKLDPHVRRGIDVVRNKIKMFAQKKVTLPPGRHKIVILDEADR